MDIFFILGASELADSNAVTVIGGALVAALTAMNGIQTQQLSGLRALAEKLATDLHEHRKQQDEEHRRRDQLIRSLAERVDDLEGNTPLPGPAPRRRTAAQSTSSGRVARRPKTQPPP